MGINVFDLKKLYHEP